MRTTRKVLLVHSFHVSEGDHGSPNNHSLSFMRFNKNAKLIPLAVLGLGLVAAVGMYLRVEQMGQSSGGGSPYASVAATAVPSPQIPGNWPIVTPGNDPQSTWLKTLNEEYRGTFVGLDRGVIAIAWPVTKEQSDALKAMGTGYDFWAGFPMLFTSSRQRHNH